MTHLMPQSHHTPGPRAGCSRAVLNKNRTSTHGARTGPMRHRTNFASPYGARKVLMYAVYAYGPRTGFEILNSPWTARAGTVRGPDGQIRRPCGIFVNFGCINSHTCPQGCRTAPLQVPHGPGTCPVGYEKHWRFPCGTSYGHRAGYPWSPANHSTKP